MFARQAVSRAVAQRTVPGDARNMATLREIELRLKSVRNIQKITNSMKVVASTKLAKAQKAMQTGKEYGIANSEIFQHSTSDKPTPNKLFIVISSDKGLCGGIHSGVSKATRKALSNADDSPLVTSAKSDLGTDPSVNASTSSKEVDPQSPVVVIGDKSKSQLMRTLNQNFRVTFNQIGKDIPTFADAASVADIIVKSGVKYDSAVIIYNRFLSAISYEPAAMEVKGEEALKESDAFKAYENEDDVTKDLAEFSLANAIYAALTESHACEQSSRRNAMDNASKNAGEMINTLQLQYNRGRQAAITNELVDIITGASAL
ncbi:putative atp synthase subunit gamma [Lyophyllum shimeji]|uniref:ATP synthase subunit gamma, mitochondrial n=1 Tax=Lyophyllum shimeji TaxID=47721 RepID=A0A9P3PQT4_LYOSH|nr:putative atp synthase subunit gamma [Lyophyllum shimeji]